MKTHAKTHGLRRFLCGLTALATAALMVPLSAMASNTDGHVTVDKTATPLDSNNQTTVTLDIRAGSTTLGSDVVFVLDKSTSTQVKNEAMSMLEELMEQTTDNSIKVGVVTFNNNASNEEANLQLTPLNEQSKNAVQEVFDVTLSSGTNIEAGIMKGIEMLQADNTVPSANKHLVLVTDGVSYLWGEDSPKTVYVQFNGKDNATPIWSSNSIAASVVDINFFKITQADYVNSFSSPVTWMNQNSAGIESALQYEESWNSVTNGAWTDGMKYISIENNTSYTSNDIALYKAGKAWQIAANCGYNLYSYVSDDFYNNGATDNVEGHYPWAANFFSNFDDIGGYSTMYSDTESGVTGMFDDVRDTILYTIENGTVTDIIGEDFNFAGIDTLSLSVNGDQYTAVRDDLNNTVQFYNPNGQEGETAAFTVFYTTDSSGEEVLTWEINEEISGSVSLSYKLNLDPNSPNLPTGGVSAKLPTNESACLEYTGTDNTKGNICFPKPTVTIGSEPEQGGDDDDEDDNPPVIIPDNPSLTIRKIWENDSVSDRPDSITVDIYHDGEYYDSMEISGRRFGNSDTWRDSYEIPARYEDDDWWVVESDVPAYYDSDVEEVRENVFYITNTYEEPVIEEPVSSEPESSEPSSEPSEVIPSGPSEPSAPSSEPTSEPSEPAEPTLPQTGQVWWPVILLLAGGAVLVAFGAFRTIRGNGRRER